MELQKMMGLAYSLERSLQFIVCPLQELLHTTKLLEYRVESSCTVVNNTINYSE